MIKLAIVIVNWNSVSDTVLCLESLNRLIIPQSCKISIIVVDNGSTDGSYERLLKIKTPFFNLIKQPKNIGFSGGYNVGLRFATQLQADWIMILNNDTLVDRKCLQLFIKNYSDKFENSIISPKIYFAPGFEYHKDRYSKALLGKVIWSAGGDFDWKNCFGINIGVDEVDRGQFDQVQKINFASGACFFINSKLVEKIGYFDEKLFLYFEDADYSVRAKKAKADIVYDPRLIIWHKVAQSSGIGSDLNDYFISRNRMLFGLRYAPLKTKLALFRESVKFLVKGRKWQKRGIKDFYLGSYGIGSWNKK